MIKNSILIIASLAVAFLAAEVLLRMMGYHGEASWRIEETVQVDDPILNYRLRPHSVSYSDDVEYKLNNSGFRDLDRDVTRKQRGAMRVLVLGDSVAFGYKVKFPDILSRQLEGLLQKQFPDRIIEVVSLALPGLNTLQESHLLELEGKAYEPDLVVVAFVLNDADGGLAHRVASENCRFELLHLPIPCGAKTVLKKSAFLFFVKNRVDLLVWKMGLGDQDDPNHSLERDYFGNLYRDDRKVQKHVVTGFHNIATIVKEKNVPVVVVIFPVMFDFNHYRWDWVHNRVRCEAQRQGFRVVDLFGDFQRYRMEQLRVERGDFVHPNKLGHAIAAQAVAGSVIQQAAGTGRTTGDC